MPARKDYVTYGLIAAAAALTGVYLLDRDKPTTKEQGERAGMLLRVFRHEDVTRITLQRGGEKIELVREGDQWKLVSPRVARADFFAVESFLNALQGGRPVRALGQIKGGERAQLGLDAPRATAEIAMKGVTLKLSLGGIATGADSNDAGVRAAYVEVAPYGDQPGGVFVVEPDVAAALDRTADSFRDPSLVEGHLSPQYQKVEVAGLVTLERGAHGTWRLPGNVRADADEADALFLSMYQMKADPFVADSTPIDTSKGATITATLIEGGAFTVAFGGPCPADPKLVVAQAKSTPPITGCIQPTVADRLKFPADRYADDHAFALIAGTMTAKTSEIESVVVEGAGKKLVDVERRGDGLHMRAPSDEQVDKDAADRYLARLANVSGPVVQQPDLAKLGLAPPQGKVTLVRVVEARLSADAGRDRWEQVVEVGNTDASKKVVYVRRADDGAVLEVPLIAASPLLAGAAMDLRSGTLLQLSAEAITRVTAKPDVGTAWELQKTNGAWSMVAPAGVGADASAAGKLASDLAAGLACVRWLEKDDGTFGAARATLDVQAGDKSATIELGADAADGVLARVKGRDAICVLPKEKVAAVFHPPFDERNVSFDPTAHGTRLVVTHDKTARTIAFDPVTKTWTDAPVDGGAAGSLLARKLGDAIHGLRATELVHTGAAKKDEGFDAPTLTIEGFEGATKKKTLRIGAAGPNATYYARVDGTDATYVIAKADVAAILESL